MKITVYTITDCEFSKQEKEYLASHQLQYEEKNLETNKEFLTEMLAVSNNFAGTPVTKIEKDDGQIVILKGFTKDEFDKTLRLTPVEEPAAKTETQKPVGEKVAPLPTTVELVAQPADTQPVNPTDSNRPADTSAGPIPTDSTVSDPLNSILNDLQAKSSQTDSSQSFDSAQDKPVDQVGPIQTDLNPSAPPTVPDFPTKT